MIVKCLSVKNPLSYLICAGMKDVENRSWNTDYRGTVFIHSSGSDKTGLINEDCIYGCDYESVLPIHAEFEKIVSDRKKGITGTYKFLNAYNNIISLKDHSKQKEYDLFKYNSKYTMHSQAIIGKVDLVDVIKDSNSLWSIDGQYHWILKNPALFTKPVLYVKGKLRFFNYDLKEAR